jgi:4-hydroxybenzoate polyprenyltransferase
LSALRLFLREIRVEHTLFALPFAYVGAVLAARGVPALSQLFWITLAVVGARTAAMAANRFLDREIDARNPRTAPRALPSGLLSPAAMVWATIAGLVVLTISAWMLNPLCVALLPIAAALLLIYPLCKRFTWSAHFVLGAVDGLAPLGAYIAVAATITPAALALFAAVTLWVAGFDIVYALMDLGVDRAQGIRSLPVRFGERTARVAPVVLHGTMLALLALAGMLDRAGSVYYVGVAAVGVLILYEEHLFRSGDTLASINQRVFLSNMAFSVFFLLTTVGAYR